MTEHQLSEIARLNRSREGYRLALLQWADWAEERGLDYAAGLREMAAPHIPRRPAYVSFAKYRWISLFFGESHGVLAYKLPMAVYDELSRIDVSVHLSTPMPFTYHVTIRGFLDAVREAAKAYVRVKRHA